VSFSKSQHHLLVLRGVGNTKPTAGWGVLQTCAAAMIKTYENVGSPEVLFAQCVPYTLCLWPSDLINYIHEIIHHYCLNMTSPGVKRPLEYDSISQPSGLSPTEGSPHAGATGSEITQSSIIKTEAGTIAPTNNFAALNGTKRRCTTINNLQTTSDQQIMNPTKTSPPTLAPATPSASSQHQASYITQAATFTSNSPFKDPQSILAPISDNVASLIKEELLKASSKVDNMNGVIPENQTATSEPPILTARQTQTICERLIREREVRLRDEYDRILARKLAEQYDVFAKANYLNSFVEPSQRIPSSTTEPVITQPSATGVQSNSTTPSINAFAAALQIQRSVGAASVASSTQSVSTAQNSLTDLNQFATSLTAPNGHHSGVPTAPHQHISFSQFHQQAAAAAAAAAAALHQANAAHHGHHQQSRPQQSQHMGQPLRVAPNTIGQAHPGVPGSMIPSGPVLLVSNIDEQLAIPEALFTLFGVFGDVIRVKILFNKKDNALIQMADAAQAQVAQGYLDKQRIYGKIIRVTRSKHQLVQMPRDGNQSDAGLTKDFVNSPLHRFKIPGSRNYLNIYPPSNTLHISNIPAIVDESHLSKAFKEQCGFDFTSFKFFPKDRKMALMKFGSTEHATIALIKMHNFQISEENNLRVSFSKMSI